MLKQQINDKQKENEFLKEQLTQITTNFTLVNKILENKIINHNKKFLGLF